MTKAFLHYMDTMRIEKGSIPEFNSLKDNISAFEGLRIFELITEGTKFVED
jgi:hypothetical protein